MTMLVLMTVPTTSGTGVAVGATAAASTASATYPTPIQHVIIVLLENQPAKAVLAKGPYEREVASAYAYSSHYYALCHPSAPNYLGLTSGETYQCGTDSHHLYGGDNVADLVTAAHMTWGAFAENMPHPCDTSDAGLYSVDHEPFAYYQDIVQNPSVCDSHVVGFGPWDADVASGNIPNYVFLSPNRDHDGHDTGVAGADSWLQSWLPGIISKSWFQHSAIFIVYDESSSHDTSGYGTAYGGNVYMTLVSPYAKGGFTSSAEASHYNLLTTVEWLLGLGNSGHQDANTKAWPPMKDLFTFGS